MKKLFILFLLLNIVFLATGCAGGKADVMTSAFFSYDVAKELLKDTDKKVEPLIEFGKSEHSALESIKYSKMRKLKKADLFIYTSETLDQNITKNKDNLPEQSLNLFKTIFPNLEDPIAHHHHHHDDEEHEHDHDHHHHHHHDHEADEPSESDFIKKEVTISNLVLSNQVKEEYKNKLGSKFVTDLLASNDIVNTFKEVFTKAEGEILANDKLFIDPVSHSHDSEGIVHLNLILVKDNQEFQTFDFELEGFKKGEEPEEETELEIKKYGITLTTKVKDSNLKCGDITKAFENSSDKTFNFLKPYANFTATEEDLAKTEILSFYPESRKGVLWFRVLNKDLTNPSSYWFYLKDLNPYEIDETHALIHYWASPLNMLKVIDIIKDKLVQIYPEIAEKINQNHTTLKTDFNKEIQKMRDFLEKSPNKSKKIVFIGHDSMGAFAKDFDLTYYPMQLTIQDREITKPELTEIQKEITSDIKVIYKPELNEQEKTVETILRELKRDDLEVLELNGYHNISSQEAKENITYLDLLKRNVSNIIKGLSK